ncbi:diacylglycerol kinase family protein [Patescibacteria group bacterium]
MQKKVSSFSSKRKKYPLYRSFSFAFKGIFKTIKRERNVRIHLGAAVFAIILGLVFNISPFEWLSLVLIISAVISAEIMNSSVEATCDLLRFKLKLDYYETYWIRNFAAGAVMVLAVGAVIIGLIIFLPKIF